MSEQRLDEICARIRAAVPGAERPFDYRFYGNPKDSNLFARIVRGEEQQWRVWEDVGHVAFLTPFGNVPGFTVVVPRRHLTSDILGLRGEEFLGLVEAAWEVGGVLKRAFGVERCGMVFEGFEVDYAHVKLVPVLDGKGWGREVEGGGEEIMVEEPFTEKYKGYVTSLPGPLANDMEVLERDAALIRTLLHNMGV